MTRRVRGIKRHTQKTTNLSSQTNRILKRYWKSICSEISKTSVPLTTKIAVDDIPMSDMYSYIPDKIRNEFETSQQSCFKCDIVLKSGRNVKIYIATPENRTINIKIYLRNIIAWLNFVGEVASPECAQTLNIYLLLTDAKKRFPDRDTDPIDMIHANTAFTTSCSSNNSIFIFRREEWFKVFMHETFHSFGLDFSSSGSDESNRRILSIFPVIDPSTDIRLYETFCEMWAEIFNIMFCIFMDKHGKYSNFESDRFFVTLQKERIFSINQSNKILRRTGYQYSDIFKRSSSQHSSTKLPSENHSYYHENTQAFSYYVIKSIMLWYLDKFIGWCLAHNGDNLIQFNPKCIADYCDFVKELTEHDESYRQAVHKRTGGNSTVQNEDESLRMTKITPLW